MLCTLKRLETGPQGTFGVIKIRDNIFYTGELPWRDNLSNISCVPPGSYEVRETFSPRFRRLLYQVINVPNRENIRIHPANLMGGEGYLCQLNGCIALGEKLGTIEKQKAILISAPAVTKFMSLLNHQPFTLEVV